MSSNLPLELQYRILSSLSPKDAMPCALVCRDWVAESRKIGLSRAILITVAGGESEGRILNDLLIHPHSTFRLYLSNVTVELADVGAGWRAVVEHGPPLQILQALVDRGAPLQSLRIERMQRGSQVLDLVIRLLKHSLTHLHTLDLNRWNPTPDFAHALLNLLSTSRTLIHFIAHIEVPGPRLFLTKPPPSPPPSLRILETSDYFIFKAWLFKADHVRQYKLIGEVLALTDMLCDYAATKHGSMIRLHGIHYIRTDTREMADRFFATPQCVGVLTHLMVHSDEYNDLGNLDLGLAVHLESLDIDLELICGNKTGEEYFSWVARVLRTARAGVVVHLTLQIACQPGTTTPEAIHELDEAIDSYFDKPDNDIRSAKALLLGYTTPATIGFALCKARGKRGRKFVFEDSRARIGDDRAR